MKENKNIYGAEKVAKKGEIYSSCGVEMGWSQMERRVGTQAVAR
jgi:hypothetical protein